VELAILATFSCRQRVSSSLAAYGTLYKSQSLTQKKRFDWLQKSRRKVQKKCIKCRYFEIITVFFIVSFVFRGIFCLFGRWSGGLNEGGKWWLDCGVEELKRKRWDSRRVLGEDEFRRRKIHQKTKTAEDECSIRIQRFYWQFCCFWQFSCICLLVFVVHRLLLSSRCHYPLTVISLCLFSPSLFLILPLPFQLPHHKTEDCPRQKMNAKWEFSMNNLRTNKSVDQELQNFSISHKKLKFKGMFVRFRF
jgi:hypothetical protein